MLQINLNSTSHPPDTTVNPPQKRQCGEKTQKKEEEKEHLNKMQDRLPPVKVPFYMVLFADLFTYHLLVSYKIASISHMRQNVAKPYFQRKVAAGVVLSAVLTVVTSAGALWSHTEKVHAWSHQSAATVGESMSVVYGKQNQKCPQFQAFGFPTPKTDGVVERSYSTCRLGYAGMYDAEVKTPLWVAERINRNDLKGPAKRDGLDFQDDPQVPLLDGGNQYKRSGFDKGHLAPAADFRWSQEAMNQSFIFGSVAISVRDNGRHA